MISILVLLPFVPLEMLMLWRRSWKGLHHVEQAFRRASHPPALAALVVAGMVRFHVGVRDLVQPFLAGDRNSFVLPIGGVLLAATLLTWLVGVRQVIGLRDPVRTPFAFLRLAIGGAIVGYMWPGTYPITATWPQIGLWFVGLWCLVTGAVRALLPMIGGGSALRLMGKVIEDKNAPMIGARRPRPWWKFW